MSHYYSTVQEFDLIATARLWHRNRFRAFLLWFPRSQGRRLTGRKSWVRFPGLSVLTGLDLPQCEQGHTPAVAGETHKGTEWLHASWKIGETPDTDGLCGFFFGSQSQGASVGTSQGYNLQMSRQKTHLLVLNGDTGLAPPPCQSKCPVRVGALRVFWVSCIKKVWASEGGSATSCLRSDRLTPPPPCIFHDSPVGIAHLYRAWKTASLPSSSPKPLRSPSVSPIPPLIRDGISFGADWEQPRWIKRKQKMSEWMRQEALQAV